MAQQHFNRGDSLHRNNWKEAHERNVQPCYELSDDNEIDDRIPKDTSLEDIINACPNPPEMKDMERMRNSKCTFMIAPFKCDQLRPNCEPDPLLIGNGYHDIWDDSHVHMPCSPKYTDKYKKSTWTYICRQLHRLQDICNIGGAIFEDLQITIEKCVGRRFNMESLQILIEQVYTADEQMYFMSAVLSNICNLALNVDKIFGQPPPLLRIKSDASVTMSQKQAASLLACAFFCLFPLRSDDTKPSEYEYFQNPNFNTLYKRGPRQKVEKLKCILHYFHRITEKMPNGVISIRRYVLPENLYPNWSRSPAKLSRMCVISDKKIEDINSVLQVDFANEYIGGGVLRNGCVQEEIRFSICPEMLVSLLLCERMEKNECIFLIGCERFSSYKGYGDHFEFNGDFRDKTLRDNWGRKWCPLVAMDAIFFHESDKQYDIHNVNRELIKAYASFRPRKTGTGNNERYGIATGNWGCGVFNGDRQLKAIIQLMAASEAGRPLIYAAFRDKRISKSFSDVYNYLLQQQATVGDLYQYLQEYPHRANRKSLFDYILHTPISQNL